MKFEVIDHEVWGNDEEGFEVNDSWKIGIIELSEDCTDEEILETMKEFGYFKESVKVTDIEIDGEIEYSLYINQSDNGRPLCELRRER
jgi:hypothetical protein